MVEKKAEQLETENLANPSPTKGGSFAELYEASLRNEVSFKRGTVVTGKVIKVLSDFVVVDIGFKSEGLIPIGEFREYRDKSEIAIGSEVEVFIERIEDDQGITSLSKEKADRLRVWDEIEKRYDDGETVDGRVIDKVKGGLSVDIGVKAFLPGSQIGLSPVRDLNMLVGKTYTFKIIKFNKRKGNIVLSRRALLEKERAAQRGDGPIVIEENAVVDGIVKNITDYGAFVDLGGMDGLLHITDMSWGRIAHPSELYTVGDPIKVKILKYDKERNRVSLGVKQITEDPWSKVAEQFPIGKKVAGKVVSITNYGAFVELAQGVEGLIHVSEMSWSKKVRHPNKIVNVGDAVETIVLDVNVENKRISLGLKQIGPNPWQLISDKYPPGTHIRGKITNVTDFGVFVGMDEGIDGLIHISDLTWSSKVRNPAEVYKKGDDIEAVVLHVDPDHEKFSLGVKQLSEDPWKDIEARYHRGDKVSGKIVKLTDFGAFVELEKDIEGLIHVSEISREKVEKPSDVLQEGQSVKTEILNLDSVERKISLSIRALQASSEKREMANYLDSEKGFKENLGDLFGKKEDGAPAESGEAADEPPSTDN